MKKKRISLSAEQAAVIQDAFRQGAVCTNVSGDFFMPDGKPVHATTARKLIEVGYLIPSKDGMFGTCQTYKPNLV